MVDKPKIAAPIPDGEDEAAPPLLAIEVALAKTEGGINLQVRAGGEKFLRVKAIPEDNKVWILVFPAGQDGSVC